MNLRKHLGVGLTALMAAFSSAAYGVGPNLITNPGFEATSTMAGSGWTVNGPFIFEGFDYLVDTAAADAHSGTHSFAGGAIGAPGYISQTFSTIAGRSYDIDFWIANLSGFAADTQVSVLWNGASIYNATDILGFGYNHINLGAGVRATSALSTLSIGLRDDAFFLNLDDVVVQVPEPGSLVLLLGALASVGLVRRRRSKI